MKIRRPAVAGYFYPAKKEVLLGTVRKHLRLAPPPLPAPPRALIVPHAGYDYSGRVAACGYAALRTHTHRWKKVILLGPAHTAAVEGLAADAHSFWRTPLGIVPVITGGFPVAEASHLREHALEVQLPFLQYLLPNFTLLPLLAGRMDPHAYYPALLSVLTEDTLLVFSSDLSHFYDYQTARRLDLATLDAIETLDYEKMAAEGVACGRTPILLAILLARHLGWTCRRMCYCNSGDVTGEHAQVVGYGSLAFF